MKKLAVTILLILLTPCLALAASNGESTHTEVGIHSTVEGTGSGIHEYQWVLTTHSAGEAYDSSDTFTMLGTIDQIWVVHDGTVTDNYDIALLDSDGLDWLCEDGYNFDSSATDSQNIRQPIDDYNGGPVRIPNKAVYVSASNVGANKVVTFHISIKLP